MLNAAEAWQRKRVTKAPLGDFKANYDLLITHHAVVPFASCLALTRRIVMEKVRARDIQDCFKIVWLWSSEVPPPAWEVTSPSFACLLQELVSGETVFTGRRGSSAL